MVKSLWTTMNPPQLGDNRQLDPNILSGQKVQLIYKLFLLGNSREALERELNNFTNKAYEEVQGLFSSSCCTSVLSDLGKALDFKCQVIDKVSALLKELTVDYHINLKNEANASQLQLFENKASPEKDALKTEPVLQNSRTKKSVTKAAQMFATVVPMQQQKPVLSPLPTLTQLNETECCTAPSNHSDDATVNLAPQQDAREHAPSTEKRMRVFPPPAVIHSPTSVGRELVPPTGHTEHTAERQRALGWPPMEGALVRHQKLTSSQLLHFLKVQCKNTGAPQVTVMRQNANNKENATTFSPPAVKHKAFQFEPAAIDSLTNDKAPQTLSAEMEIQIPVFKIKRVESNGSRIYSYVTATKTELWDIGDVFTEAEQVDCNLFSLEDKTCGSSVAHVEDSCKDKSQPGGTFQIAESEPIGDAAPVQVCTTTVSSLPIPEFQFPKYDEIKVVVSHIVNPGDFYVQQADSAKKLQALVTDSWESSSSYAKRNCIPDIGTKVMAWFAKQEQWCRAQVTKICGVSAESDISDSCERETSIQVEVKRLDYGDTACLSLCSVKEIVPDMVSLPLQAVQVSLANVMPVNGSEWSEVSVAWLRTMVHNRILYARFYPTGPKVTVELYLERGRLGTVRRGASVSVRLAQNGHAKHSKLRDEGLVKKSAAEEKRRKQDAEWEKYLISHYTQTKK